LARTLSPFSTGPLIPTINISNVKSIRENRAGWVLEQNGCATASFTRGRARLVLLGLNYATSARLLAGRGSA
jgi:hypothetical protein